ncbi:Flp family type IVb pilin [Arthrobacter sp. AZCC_0090]|uniref:Flp family type IVb pilin n=1 Tax=Arthrobacter sp. AZCC_0090 TaxID=2735881 RepID=UPI00161872DD|nr:Flp family type IVb pilin [Arthrobacter sp. AZCC_0090]MBB6405819.1 pilus assembly protein Flp/PilA [Arthrobacter sp. AZCC_0090]
MKSKLKCLVSSFAKERGATATEYSMLVGFIAVVIVVGVGAFGLALNGFIDGLAAAVRTALGVH